MGTTEEFLRLLVEIKGDQALTGLKKQLADLDVESAKLKAQFDAQAISEAELEAQTRKLAATSASLKAALGETTNKMAGFGQSALQTGRVVQDFAQGGLGGILNNIEGLAMALGGGPGLAGVLTLVGVGFMVLKDKIGPAAEALGLTTKKIDDASTAMEKLEKHIKALTEKPIKLTVEKNELEALEKRMAQLKQDMEGFEKLRDRRTKDEAEAGSRIKEAITEGGAGRIGDVLAATRKKELMAADPGIWSDEEQQATAQAAAERHVKANMLAPHRIPEFKGKFLANIRETQAGRRKELGGQARGEANQMIRAAETGGDTEAAARIAGMLEAADVPDKEKLGRVADKIRRATPGAVEAERLTEAGKPGEEIARKRIEEINEERSEVAIKALNVETKELEEEAKLAEKTRAPVETFIKAQKDVLTDFEATQVKRREARVGLFTKEAEKGTIDEFAAAKAAELQAQGGYTSSKGRFIPLDAGGQRAALAGELEKRIGGEYGGASKGVAANLTRGAFDAVGRQKADMQALGTMSELQINQAIIANTQQIFEQRLQALTGMAKTTGRELRQTNTSARTLQKRFGS